METIANTSVGSSSVAAEEPQVVCPFCGFVGRDAEAPCRRCGMLNTTATRQATTARLGPWFVMRNRNPSAPGMSFATLLGMVKNGKITRKTVVRGPTTQQLWRFADQTRGLSREFGACYACGQEISSATDRCPECHRSQLAPLDPDRMMKVENAERVDPAMAAGRVPVRTHNERPAPIVARPSGAGAQGEVLTASELATVFSLDNQIAVEPVPRKSRMGRMLMLLLFVLIVGLLAWLAYDPASRQKVLTWTVSTYGDVRHWVDFMRNRGFN
jgi:hypothetical protein